MIAFVDTSAFYAVLNRLDENHETADSIWKLLLEQDAVLATNNYVLVETCVITQNRLGLEAVREFQQEIVPILRVEWVTKSQHDSAMAAVLAAARKKLSLVDCVSFAMMREAGIRKAFAFDAHYVEQGFDCEFR